jgi:nucleoid DNA-binding protein
MANKKRPENELSEKEFVDYLIKANPDYHRYEYLDFLDTLTLALETALLEGKGLRLRKLGVFKVHEVPGGLLRNPGTGKKQDVPPRLKVKFSFTLAFKLALRKITDAKYKKEQDEINLAKS